MGWFAVVEPRRRYYVSFETADTPDARTMIAMAEQTIQQAKGSVTTDDIIDSIQEYAYICVTEGQAPIAQVCGSALSILVDAEFIYVQAEPQETGVLLTLKVADVYDEQELKELALSIPSSPPDAGSS